MEQEQASTFYLVIKRGRGANKSLQCARASTAHLNRMSTSSRLTSSCVMPLKAKYLHCVLRWAGDREGN
eukprot:1144902-Pelagomonas_calceolata.AAC.7